MLDCLITALKDVQNALGTSGTMHPKNISKAAKLLAKYGPEFEKTEDQAVQAVKDIRELVKGLQ